MQLCLSSIRAESVGTEVRVMVSVRNAVGGTSIFNRGQFSSCSLHLIGMIEVILAARPMLLSWTRI